MKTFFKNTLTVLLSVLMVFAFFGEVQPLPAIAATTAVQTEFSEFTITAIKNTAKGIRITWENSENADSYCIYRKTGKEKYSVVAELVQPETLAYTDTTAKNGTKYSYIVRAYNDTGYLNCEKAKSYVRLTAPTIKSVENSADYQLAVKWTKNSKAAGYQVAYSYYEDFAKYKTVTSDIGGKYLKNLKDCQPCYVKVRSYVKIGKATYYSAWSEAEEEWVDYVPPRPDGKGYVMNTNTYKFHTAGCRHVKSIHKENYDRHSSRKDLIDWGYEPCRVCHP